MVPCANVVLEAATSHEAQSESILTLSKLHCNFQRVDDVCMLTCLAQHKAGYKTPSPVGLHQQYSARYRSWKSSAAQSESRKCLVSVNLSRNAHMKRMRCFVCDDMRRWQWACKRKVPEQIEKLVPHRLVWKAQWAVDPSLPITYQSTF
eukprot:4550001-Pleurochrysis_carterae.AAC.2